MTLLLLTALSASLPVSAQMVRGGGEDPDVYEIAPPFVYSKKYERKNPRKKKLITNADFWCTACAKEGRIPYKHRDQLKDKLEFDKHYPYPVQGKKKIRCGTYRLLEQPGDRVMKVLFEEMKTKNPIYIEDRFFRLFTDFGGFSTKKLTYPRRQIELEQLSDIFPRVSKKTVRLNSHHRAHLYLIRAHHYKREFEHLVKHSDRASYMAYKGAFLGVKQKYELYIFSKQKLLGQFMLKFLGMPTTLDGICWHTLQEDAMIAMMHAQGLEDVHLNNTFSHRLNYDFVQGYRGYAYDLPAWLQLGFAHVMERRERTDFNTYLFGEGRAPKLPAGSKWKPAIRKRVVAGKFLSFPHVFNLENVADIVTKDHWIIWSMVSCLMHEDLEKFGKFIHVFKEKKKGESIYNLGIRALRSAYGMSVIQFQEKWVEWVKATYPAV